MPEIQAKPGDWPDLFGKVFALALDPTGESDGLENNEAGMFGPFLYQFIKMNPENLAKVNGEMIDLIAHSNPTRFDLGQNAKQLVYGLITSGHILSYVLRLARHNRSLASVEKAVRILEWRYMQEGSPSGTTSIKVAWTKYKSLSHFVVGLHASTDRAMPVVADLPQLLDTEAGLQRDVQIKPGGLENYVSALTSGNPGFGRYHTEVTPYVMAMAEKFRIAGEAHFAPGQEARQKPLLDPETTWRVPPGFDFPEVEMVLDPVSRDELDAATSI